jgi:predicted enzyme related to lactoylglutathione lyase
VIGASRPVPGDGHSAGHPSGWRFYFRTPDIEAAAAKVADAGGTLMMGPVEVPGGDRIIVASDPMGVVFGAVGPGQ